ncbi:fungal specific transcription factor domain-containing protein [Aspergillus luchuensis]|uniref:Fungal specific transcription factor domain-containing protein n=1 Tax=Aspergillus kawachii TaxID=1069201 RepID=A0A146FI05_ASPKA|nr:fungal specific transcription factor domain-containing protein [Aspergillus luchuensis]
MSTGLIYAWKPSSFEKTYQGSQSKFYRPSYCLVENPPHATELQCSSLEGKRLQFFEVSMRYFSADLHCLRTEYRFQQTPKEAGWVVVESESDSIGQA